MKIYTLESFEEKLKQMFPNNDITILEFFGTGKYIKYRCNKCGKIYEKSRANHIYENKTLCTHCYSAKSSKIRNWILDFLNTSKQFTLIDSWSGNTADNLKLKCNKCQWTFEKEPGNIYNKKENTICPACGDNGAPLPIEFFLQQLSPEEKEEYKILSYKGFNKAATFQHKCGLVFTRKPRNFLKSKGCPHCHGTKSVGEIYIERFLINNNISYKCQKHFPELGKRSYDFFLPQLNTLIEYQGEQHYRPVSIFGGEEHFKKQKISDAEKKEYAKLHGYTLIEIPYYHLHCIDKYLLPLLGSTTSS